MAQSLVPQSRLNQGCQNNLKRRRVSIPDAEWDSLRPIIIDLYQQNGLKLKDLCALMSDKYGFAAKPGMYKKRFAKWGVRKNYSQRQKIWVLRKGRSDKARQTINGKPVVWNRVTRKVTCQGIRTKLMVGSSVPKRNSISSPAQSDDKAHYLYPSRPSSQGHTYFTGPVRPLETHFRTQVPRTRLHQSPQVQKVERILFDARRYYSCYITQTLFKGRYDYHGGPLAHVFNAVTAAQYCLQDEPGLACELLDKACDATKQMFQQQQYQVLTTIVRLAVSPKWRHHLDLRCSWLRFMASMASQAMDANNPVPSLIRSLTEPEILEPVEAELTQVCLEVADTLMAPNDRRLLVLKLNLASDFAFKGAAHPALDLVTDVEKAAQTHFPTDKDLASRAAYRLSQLAPTPTRNQNAENILLQHFKHSDHAQDLPGKASAAYTLAHLYLNLQLVDECERYFSTAVLLDLELGTCRTFCRMGDCGPWDVYQFLRQRGRAVEMGDAATLHRRRYTRCSTGTGPGFQCRALCCGPLATVRRFAVDVI